MKLPISYKGDPVLERLADVIPTEAILEDEHQELFQNMHETLLTQKNGVALAAPQVNVSKRVFIIAPFLFETDEYLNLEPQTVCVNPKIIWHSKDDENMEEGCLSIPGVTGLVRRHPRATIEAQDADGRLFQMEASGLMAQIFQHEINHLDGILFDTIATNLKYEEDLPEDNQEIL